MSKPMVWDISLNKRQCYLVQKFMDKYRIEVVFHGDGTFDVNTSQKSARFDIKFPQPEDDSELPHNALAALANVCAVVFTCGFSATVCEDIFGVDIDFNSWMAVNGIMAILFKDSVVYGKFIAMGKKVGEMFSDWEGG